MEGSKVSQTANKEHSLALETAWQHFAEFDYNANLANKQYLSLRDWIIILGAATTLLALLTESSRELTLIGIPVGNALGVCLILVPIIGATVLAFANKFQQGESWLALRSGAEEIKKEIYLYRTILQENKRRHKWLNERTEVIQRRVFESSGGELVLKPYTEKIPPYYYPEDENSDPGFGDLLADEYLRYRLEDQLNWHSKKVRELQRKRMRLQVAIFCFGALSTFMAALGIKFAGQSISMWVASTAAIGAGVNSWLDLRQYDSTISSYSQLILDLKSLEIIGEA